MHAAPILLVTALTVLSACGRVGFDALEAGADPDSSGTDSAARDVGIDGPTDGSVVDADVSTDVAVDAPDAGVGAVRGGSYTGDGTPSRTIAVGFDPIAVIVKPLNVSSEAIFRTQSMPDGASKPMGNGRAMIPDGITTLGAGGFRIADDRMVNAADQVYSWVAFAAVTGLGVGRYDGTGSPMSITDVGFAPQWVIVADEGDGAVVVNYGASSGQTFRMNPVAGAPDGVTSFDPDGFSLGSRPFVNRVGGRFHYFAFGRTSSIEAGTYIGDGALARTIRGVGFRPALLLLRSDGTDGGYFQSNWSPIGTMPFYAGAPVADAILSLSDDAFSLGDYPPLNRTGTTYHYLALVERP